MSSKVQKSFTVTGNLKNENKYHINLHNSYVAIGSWQLCVHSMFIKCNEKIDKFVGLTTNWVFNYKESLDSNSMLEESTIIEVFYFSGNDTNKKVVLTRGKRFLSFNTGKENLILKFVNPETRKEIKKDIEFVATFTLRRME